MGLTVSPGFAGGAGGTLITLAGDFDPNATYTGALLAAGGETFALHSGEPGSDGTLKAINTQILMAFTPHMPVGAQLYNVQISGGAQGTMLSTNQVQIVDDFFYSSIYDLRSYLRNFSTGPRAVDQESPPQ